jgi:hypothetical protein
MVKLPPELVIVAGSASTCWSAAAGRLASTIVISSKSLTGNDYVFGC